MKNLLVGLVSLAILAGIGFVVFENQNKPADTEKPGEEFTQVEKETLASNYIEANISELSPTSAVLGGTFRVTDITFTSENSGTVKYEDGHIALTADFEYHIDERGDVGVQFTDVSDQ